MEGRDFYFGQVLAIQSRAGESLLARQLLFGFSKRLSVSEYLLSRGPNTPVFSRSWKSDGEGEEKPTIDGG